MMSDFDRFTAYLQFMDIKLDASSFDSRIRMQKLAYLLGVLSGKAFTKDFSTYVRGPYSRELADYYYGEKQHPKGDALKIDEEFKKELERVRFAKNLTARQLEIMATLQRLKDLGNDEEKAIKKLRIMKPYLDLGEIIEGLNNLKGFMLTEKDRKRILKEMESEFALFENAAGDGIIQ
jgi:uncharacterized protein YwgA